MTQVELKIVVSLIRAFYENDKEQFDNITKNLEKSLWDSNIEVADYINCLRTKANMWTPMEKL